MILQCFSFLILNMILTESKGMGRGTSGDEYAAHIMPLPAPELERGEPQLQSNPPQTSQTTPPDSTLIEDILLDFSLFTSPPLFHMLGINAKADSSCSLIFSAVPIYQQLHIKGVMRKKIKDGRQKMGGGGGILIWEDEILIRPVFLALYIYIYI